MLLNLFHMFSQGNHWWSILLNKWLSSKSKSMIIAINVFVLYIFSCSDISLFVGFCFLFVLIVNCIPTRATDLLIKKIIIKLMYRVGICIHRHTFVFISIQLLLKWFLTKTLSPLAERERCGAGTAYPSGSPECIAVLILLNLCVVFCRSLFVCCPFSFILSDLLQFTASVSL